MKSMGLAQKYAEYVNSVLGDINLWNNLGFSLYAVPSIYCMVTTSDKRKKFKMEVSTDWCVIVEHQRSSSIKIIFINYQTSKLQCNY